MDLEVCYLLLLPYQSSLPLGPLVSVQTPKDAPYFFELDIEFRSIETRQLDLDGTAVTVHLQMLDGLVWVAECHYWLKDALSETAVGCNRQIQTRLKQTLPGEAGIESSLSEEYTIILLQKVEPTPDQFVNQHVATLARLLRSWTKSFNIIDAGEILESRARYSEDDLTVINWGGALIIAEKGDFQPDIELLKIGNYQLLRYRLLDQTIAQHLQYVRRHLRDIRRSWSPWSNRTLQVIVEQRLALLLDFEKIDQSLLLIGDWYSARVYRLMVKELCLDKWKDAVSFKLDNLAAIDNIVRENLVFSWRRLFDFISLVGWLILLIGYFILFFMNLG
jgi:hypothetical protein